MCVYALGVCSVFLCISLTFTHEREGNSPSYFNRMEITKIIDILTALFEYKSNKVRADEIGIITPYNVRLPSSRKHSGTPLQRGSFLLLPIFKTSLETSAKN